VKVLLTGCAGFIGSFVTQALLARGDEVAGVDNLSAYYDVRLKEARLECLAANRAFAFHRLDIAERPAVERLFASFGDFRFQHCGVEEREQMAALFRGERPKRVIHLAAQAGVRYSLENPHAYVDANLTGFVNLIEQCRHAKPRHFVFASSSSVYGNNRKLPFAESDSVDHPISLYAATKKANELIAHSYAHLFRLPCTGLRFFTVYGPWGRPDMALFKFTKAILAGEPIPVFNRGEMVRDFTYIDDVVEGLLRVCDQPPSGEPPYRIFNLGNSRPVKLLRYIEILESCLGRKAKLDLQPLQPGDVPETVSDTSALAAATGFSPSTTVDEGVRRFVEWYRAYYKV
jgi:UDP-glucuronate 4-epimerase